MPNQNKKQQHCDGTCNTLREKTASLNQEITQLEIECNHDWHHLKNLLSLLEERERERESKESGKTI